MRCKAFLFLLALLSTFQCLTLKAQSVEFQRGIQLYNDGFYSEAARVFASEIEQNPHIPLSYLMLSTSYLEEGFPILAENIADEGIEKFEDEAAFLWIKAEALLRQKLPEQASEIFRHLFREYEVLKFSDIVGITETRIRNRWIDSELGVSALAYQQGDFDEAMQSLETILRLNNAHQQALKNRVFLAMEQENWNLVIDYAERGLEYYPEDSDLVRMKASAFYQLDDLTSLLSEYQLLYDEDPYDIETAINYAEILFANQRGGDAEQVYVKLLQRYDDEIKIYKAFAELQERRMYFDSKISVLEVMLEQFPNDEEGYVELAETYELQENWEKAREVYFNLEKVTGVRPFIGRRIAQTWLNEEKVSEAESVLKEYMEIAPENTSIIIMLSEVLQAGEKWNESLRLLLTLPEELRYSSPGLLIGLAHYELGDFTQSEEILEMIADNGINDPMGWFLRARIANSYDVDKSLALTTRAVKVSIEELDRNSSLVRDEIQESGGFIQLTVTREDIDYYDDLSKQTFDYLTENFQSHEIEPVLEELLNEYRQSPNLYYKAAEYYAAQNHQEKSEELLQTALRVNSNFFEAHFLMGSIQEKKENYTEAALFYERALSADPESHKTFRAIVRVYNLQDKMDLLADRWKTRYRVERENELLKEFLIEALHRANRFDEANELISGN